MFIYPSASGRVEGWRHHDEPSHNYKMAAKSAIMIHYPRAGAHIPKSNGVQEELEFKKELNMIHYPRAAACLFTRLRAEESKVP